MAEDIKEFSISWTGLRYWEECKQLGYLVSQRRKNPTMDVRNFFHGNVVDRIMRNWLDTEEPEPGMMVKMVDEYMDKTEAEVQESGKIKWKHKKDRDDVRNYCVELVTRLEPILMEEVLPYEYEPAVRFAVPVRAFNLDGEEYRLILKGEFDLLVRNQDSGLFRVWDLKATQDNNYWKKTLGQLVFYDLAVFAMFGSFPERSGLIQPMCDERAPTFTHSMEDRQQLWSRINRVMEAQWKGDYAPKESNTGCSFCVVKHGCEKFKGTINSKGKRIMSFGAGRACEDV